MKVINNLLSETYEDSIIETYYMGVFFILIIIMGNYLSETIGCQTQKLLDIMVVKNLFVYFTIYFTIYLSQHPQNVGNPLANAWKAFIIWVLFKCFTHMNVVPTLVVIIIVLIIFVISNYRQYIKQTNIVADVENIDKSLTLIQKVLFNLTIIIISVSCIIYYIDRRKEYKKNFSIFKFIFGTKKCKGTPINWKKLL